MRRSLRGRDVGVLYGAVVTITSVVIGTSRPSVAHELIQESSTNLVNLRDHPALVLIISAFVEPSWEELAVVVPLVVVCVLLQGWLGRAATVVVLVLGHVGATLLVATALSAGITHGAISRSESHASDVGVSYALVAALGVLSARLPQRWRPWYVAGLSAFFLVLLLTLQTFTDLGHLSAWLIGLALATLVTSGSQRAS